MDNDKIYIGEKNSNGEYHGYGILKWNESVSYYYGEFKNGKYSGNGVLFDDYYNLYSINYHDKDYYFNLYNDLHSIHYSGSFIDGEFEGNGTIIKNYYDSKEIYHGQFSKSKYEGIGYLINEFENSFHFFYGLFKNDKLNENGFALEPLSVFPSLYIGNFKDGRKFGKGKRIRINKCVGEKGIFEDDKLIEGTYTEYGLKFDGKFNFEDFNEGKIVFDNNLGLIFNGKYSNANDDELHFGDGEVILNDKTIFKGKIKENLCDGICWLSLIDSTILEGNFIQGLPDGFCKITYPNKSILEGLFKEGLPIDVKAKFVMEDGDLYDGSVLIERVIFSDNTKVDIKRFSGNEIWRDINIIENYYLRKLYKSFDNDIIIKNRYSKSSYHFELIPNGFGIKTKSNGEVESGYFKRGVLISN